MGPGVGAQRGGPVPKRMSDENHHDCTGPPCVCACVGKNNIKEGGLQGSRAPSGRLRRQLTRQVVQSCRPVLLSLVPAGVAVGGLA